VEEATALLPRLAERIQASQDLRDEAAV